MSEIIERSKKESFLLESYYTGKLLVASVSVVISVLFCYILWPYADHTLLLVWCSVLNIGNLYRIMTTFVYHKKKQFYSYKFWLNQYVYPTSIVGIIWGCVSFLMIGTTPHSLDLIIVCYVLGMVIGAAVGNISHKGVALTYSFGLMVPYFIKVCIESMPYKTEFIIAFILFSAVIYKMIVALTSANERNLNLIAQKEELLDELQQRMNVEKELSEEKLKNVQNAKLISLGEITGGIAHEINNPLTILVGKLFQLKKKVKKNEAPEELVKDIDVLNSVVMRIGNIVKVMRQLSRKDEDVQLEELELNEMINLALSNIEEKILEYPIEIDHSAVQNAKIKGIEEHIIQTMSNLISNAIDELKTTDKPWIKISTVNEDSRIKVYFTDSGLGINEEVQEKLFEPFFTTKDVGEGSGLGLSISKSLMKRIEGDLYYELKDGHTNFVVELTNA